MKKLITLISLVCLLFIGGAAPIIASENDFEKFQRLAANAFVSDGIEKIDIVNSEDLAIKVQLNSGIGRDDWSDFQQLVVGTQFQYRIQISNTSGGVLQSDLHLSELNSKCVKVRNAKIQNVAIEMSDNNFLIPASFLEYGEQITIYVVAEYVGNEEKCASSLTISGVSEDFSEFRIESNEVGVGRGGCEEVDMIITGSYSESVYDENNMVVAGCCIEIELINNYPEVNAFDKVSSYFPNFINLTMKSNGWWTGYGGGVDSLIIFSLQSPFPNTDSLPLKFLDFCIPLDTAWNELEFYWMKGETVICTTTLLLDCGVISSTDSYLTKHDLKVFPNPAHSLLNIQVDGDIHNANAIIYSSEGKKVHASNLNFFNKTATLDIGNLADGLYILQLQTEEGETEMIKFVKMN